MSRVRGTFATPKREFFQFLANNIEKFQDETGYLVETSFGLDSGGKSYWIPGLSQYIYDGDWIYWDINKTRIISDSVFRCDWNVID